MTARAIMVQGTASSVGKSLVVSAMCRFFRRQGLRVAPFKAQNMALNAFVTAAGGEIGRAQAVQAEAAGVAPTVDMNPILLKPEGDATSQVVVLGKPIGRLTAADYHAQKTELRGIVRASLARLRAAFDLVVIEGAGSPAEINLKDRDIVNMFVAGEADCKVVLVGDIDRGGVFAAFVGTMELLEPHERARVGALLVNKFRGDPALLAPGLRSLEARTGVPVLGVLPYLRRLRLADEDSQSLDERPPVGRAGAGVVDIAVVRVPRMSNHDDFLPLEHEPDTLVRFVERPRDIEGVDLVVLPGSKSTIADLAWLRASGMADAVARRVRRGEPVLGICGGLQMLGRAISDPDAVESAGPTDVEALGLLPVTTRFSRDKRTAQVRARSLGPSLLADAAGVDVGGYEIHMGRVGRVDGAPGAFAIVARNGAADDDVDGVVSADGLAAGTMLHGLFDNDAVRSALVARLRRRKGLAEHGSGGPPRQDEYDRLADALRDGIDVPLLHGLLGP